MEKTIGVGMIGYAFMGRAHSNGWRQVGHFFDLPMKPVMKTICGRNKAAVTAAAKTMGWEKAETDWMKMINDPQIQVVDICTPGNEHKPMALAALKAGKHVVCEKPLANTLAEAKEMAQAAKEAGVRTLTAFNYRRVPAIALAKQMIDQGLLGTIYHWRAVYLQDWIIDPKFPLVWRLKKEVAGSGPHGDLNAHITDLARYLVGEITEVVGMGKTFIKTRPVQEALADGGLGAKAGTKKGKVTVEDAMLFLAKFANGALGSFEATRFAAGRKNFNSFEINGSKGSIVFNLERLNELQYFNRRDDANLQGFRTILCNEGGQPYNSAWWPSGHIIGWEHTFTHEFKDFIEAIAAKKDTMPNFEDGMKTQAVLEAVMASADKKKWVKVTI
ncbi:MAG TPA: Gfo/Idh/MocA family oxidoreductase [Candidatus Latescibacteria bacterium]|nr:Gfo/Idh/MocA family oxidoreductase [Candidatus Latescibacterota bacterium]